MVNTKGFENKGLSSYNGQTSVGMQGSGQGAGATVAGVSKQGIEPKKVVTVPVESMIMVPHVDPLSKMKP